MTNYQKIAHILVNIRLIFYQGSQLLAYKLKGKAYENFMIIIYRESGEAEALEQFLFGLRGDLQHQVRVRSPRNLTGTMAEAIRIEQKTSARRGEPKISDGVPTSAALTADTLLKELVTKISALTTESP